MKKTISRICSICALIAPIITTIIFFCTEPEFTEALAGGIIIGCLIGSVFGAVALVCNKHHSKWIMAASILPMIPTVLFALLAIPFYLYK